MRMGDIVALVLILAMLYWYGPSFIREVLQAVNDGKGCTCECYQP